MEARATVLRAAGLAWIWLAGPVPGAAAAETGSLRGPLILERGTPLGDALEYLRTRGLRVVYSDTLVRPDFTVRQELRGDSPGQVARKALAPWGLELRGLEGGLVAVVAARDANWRLRGRVLSTTDLSPVAGARVEVQGGNFVDWTDELGRFSLHGPVGAPVRVRVTAGGYAPAEQDVATRAGELEPLSVDLAPGEVELGEVTVVASRFAIEKENPGAFVLDQAAFIAQPKDGEDALQATQRLPGMAFSGYSGRPNVRGGETGEALVLVDGMPVRQPFHLAGYNSAFSVIDEYMVARLTTYSGSMPARYANRLAAVIDVESVEAGTPTPNVIGASSFNARLQLRGSNRPDRADGAGWLAALRRGTLGSWLEHAAPDLGRPDTSDAFFKIVSRDAAGNEFGIRGLLARSEYSYTDDETGEWARLRGQASYVWAEASRTMAGVHLGALLGHSWIDGRREGQLVGGLTPSGRLRDVRRARLWDLRLIAEGNAGARHRLQAGLTLASGRSDYDYYGEVRYHDTAVRLFALPAERSRDLELRSERDLLGLHLEDRWQLHNRVYLEFGARMDRAFNPGSSGAAYFSPRVALRWNQSNDTTWRVGWSRASQLPEAHELRVEDGETVLPGSQQVSQTVASFEHRFRRGLVLRAEVYDRRMPDPRVRHENVFDQLRALPELAADRITIAPERSQAQGMELSALWEKGAWTGWGAYTWSRVRDRVEGQWVDREWDQRHTVHLSVAWRKGSWTLGGEVSIHSGRPATAFDDESLLNAELGPRSAARFPAHHSLDLRVARGFRLGAGRLNAYLQLTNALNMNNRCCTELDLPDEDSDPLLLEVQPQPSYPLVPALGFRYEF